MSITDGTILKVVCTMTWADAEVNQNVYNAVITGGGGPWDAEDVLEDALDWASEMYAELNDFMHEDLTGSHVTVYEYDSVDDDWDEVGEISWNYHPGGVGDPLPRGIAYLVNAKSLDPDLSGKKYIPGTMEARLDDGLWSSTLLTALAAFAVEWLTGFVGFTTSATWTPVIWSVLREVAYPTTGTAIIPAIPAYQRRRKMNVGI